MDKVKDFLTGESNEIEEKVYTAKLAEVNRELVDSLPTLQSQFNSIKAGEQTNLEVRSVSVSMPAAYWKAFDGITEVFQLREEFNIRDADDHIDEVQDNVMKALNSENNLTLRDVLMSQFMLDTVLGFAIHVARSQFIDKIQSALESDDPEALARLAKSFQMGALPDEPDDSDDDSET